MKLVKHLCLILAFLIALPVALLAQISSGSISGTVSDPNGAVVPGATVVATHVPTGRAYTNITSQAGLYVFPNLPTGPYSIAVKQTGFKAYVQTGIEVRMGLRETIDIKLVLGTVQQTVEVKATAPVLETANATRGTGISPQTMAALPLWNGSMETANSFVGYMPGVNTNSLTSVNGSNGRAMEIEIDGASLVNPESGGLAYYFPGFYAYSEMKLNTSGYSAENGRVGGGIQEYVTRSGTNAVHGAAFFNFKRQFLDAVPWFTNATSHTAANFGNCGYQGVHPNYVCRPMERFNEEGGYAGGPVYIPHVYDGRNRTFFFFTWAGVWQPTLVSPTNGETVPTQAMRQGDFSALLGLSTPLVIYNPATTANGTRTAFSGNIIPTASFSAISSKILAQIPLPNQGSSTTLGNNYNFNSTTAVTDKNWSFKIDHSIHARNRIGFFMTHRNQLSSTNQYLPGPLSNGLDSINAPFYERATDDFVVNPHILIHSYWGFSQERQLWHNPLQNGWGTKFGFPLTAGTNEDATPYISFINDLNNCCTSWGMNQGKVNNGGQWNWTTTVGQGLTWIHNKHEIKMGWEIRRLRTVGNDWAGSNGSYVFNRMETAYSATDKTSGSSFASFLLGDADSATQSALPIFIGSERYGYQAGYIQDNWRLRPRFTVNIGVRYEVPIGMHYVNGNSGNFNPTAADYFPAANGAPAVSLPGAVEFMGTGTNRYGADRSYPTDFSEVGPRMGFAWNVKPSIVVRGSFSIFYQALGSNDCCQDGFGGGTISQGSDGFNPAFNWDPNGYNPFKPTGNPGGVQPSPSFAGPQLIPGVDNFGGWFEGGGNDLVYQGPHFGKAPRIYDWNFTVQKEYKKWLFEAAYVGNRGHGTNSSMLMNSLPTTDLYLGTAGPTGDKNLLQAPITDPNLCIQTSTYSPKIGCTNGVPNLPFSTFATGFAGSATMMQALRQYPQYKSISYNNSGDGKTWYDSLQTKVERRFGDLNFMGSYVYSKMLDRLSYMEIWTSGSTTTQGAQDYYNPYNDKSYGFFDIPNFVNVVASYKLPFGRGKKFLQNANPVVNHLAGNWTFAWTQQYRSGTLSQITNSTDYLNAETGVNLQKATPTGLPIRTGIAATGLLPNNPNTRWFNSGTSSPFATTPAFTLGAASYYNSQFRQPWFRNENISFNKQVIIRESTLLNFQVNVYNPFNRSDMGGINASFASAAFGEATGVQDGARAITMGLRLEF